MLNHGFEFANGLQMDVGAKMGIPFGHFKAAVSKELRDDIEGHALDRQPRGKGVAQGVEDHLVSGFLDALIEFKFLYGAGECATDALDLNAATAREHELAGSHGDALQFPLGLFGEVDGSAPIVFCFGESDLSRFEVDMLATQGENFTGSHAGVEREQGYLVSLDAAFFDICQEFVSLFDRKEANASVVRSRHLDVAGRYLAAPQLPLHAFVVYLTNQAEDVCHRLRGIRVEQLGFDILQVKRGDLREKLAANPVFEMLLVTFVFVGLGLRVLGEREVGVFEALPRLVEGDVSPGDGRWQIAYSGLPDTFASDLGCEGCVDLLRAFADLLPLGLAVDSVNDVEGPIRLSLPAVLLRFPEVDTDLALDLFHVEFLLTFFYRTACFSIFFQTHGVTHRDGPFFISSCTCRVCDGQVLSVTCGSNPVIGFLILVPHVRIMLGAPCGNRARSPWRAGFFLFNDCVYAAVVAIIYIILLFYYE
nr:hypothetical protein [Pseudodesulfovibrio sp.]